MHETEKEDRKHSQVSDASLGFVVVVLTVSVYQG